jgi:hypothetical protein
LTDLKTPDNYTRLEKREGHFVDLHKYLRSYQGSAGRQAADWEYTDDDVNDLKKAYFTYIRLGIPVASTRVIARPASRNGFFCYSDIWKDFVKDYKKIVKKTPDVDIDALKVAYPDVTKAELVNKVDKQWKEDVEEELDENLFYYESVLGDKLKTLEPLRLLKRAKSTIYQIDLDILRQEMDDEKRGLISDIEVKVIALKELF